MLENILLKTPEQWAVQGFDAPEWWSDDILKLPSRRASSFVKARKTDIDDSAGRNFGI